MLTICLHAYVFLRSCHDFYFQHDFEGTKAYTPMTGIESITERSEHPVDIVEKFASLNEWVFDREQEDEICVQVTGKWADYRITFTWLPHVEALHLACAFPLKAPDRRKPEILALVSLLNEQLWVGHFDFWSADALVLFRQSLLLSGGIEPTPLQCEMVLKTAVTACESYFQAFQFVLWSGKTAREALDGVMFETCGEA